MMSRSASPRSLDVRGLLSINEIPRHYVPQNDLGHVTVISSEP